jgi:hypothetical protein
MSSYGSVNTNALGVIGYPASASESRRDAFEPLADKVSDDETQQDQGVGGGPSRTRTRSRDKKHK